MEKKVHVKVLRAYEKDKDGSLSGDELTEAPAAVKNLFKLSEQRISVDTIIAKQFGQMPEHPSKAVEKTIQLHSICPTKMNKVNKNRIN